MIFLTVGSQKFPFDRLLKGVDDAIKHGEIDEEVVAQRGTSKYVPVHYKSMEFMDRDLFQANLEHCSLVLTHAGTGTIVRALKMGKRVVAVPRLAKYGEHVDDHQLQIIEAFEQGNLLCTCSDMAQLGETIHKAQTQEFAKLVSNTQRYVDEISAIVEGRK